MTTSSNVRLTSLVLTGLLVLSLFAPVGMAAPAGSTDQLADDAVQLSETQAAETQTAETQTAETQATISDELREADGTTEVVVRLRDARLSESMTDREAVSRLQTHAAESQRSLLAFAKRTDGVRVLNRFWITNAVLVEVDQEKVDLDRLAAQSYVTKLHPNFQITIPEGSASSADASSSLDTAANDAPDTTYGVEQVNATEVWEAYGTKGDGVKVAVLDTGVDVSHPDIDLYTEDPGNATYPGGWAEFDSEGNQVPGSEPHDTDTHGTHTSGTVSGGNASGEYIGVAPEVDLMHGLVIPAGGGSFAQVAGGMEWAVTEDADVISMSLGANGYYTEMIEPVRNAQAAGTVVVASSGNSGEGTSGSPGNVYESVAVGASDEDANIASFSSGEEVDTESAWGSDAPASWPDTYVVPDVAAPGVAVKSSVPGGGYAEYDGTSMAAPHAAGTVALMLAAAGDDLPPSTVKTALYDTAWKPAGEPAGNDTRYGTGIVDAKAAADQVALENGVNGTVYDDSSPSPTPIEGATVETDDGFADATDANGDYSVLAHAGEREVTADAFGYASKTKTVTVTEGEYATANFYLSPELDVELLEGQPTGVKAGESVTVTVNAANLESATVALAGDYDQSDATLYVNGEEASFGDPVTFDDPYTGEVNVTVATAPDTNGTVSLEHTFEGLGDSATVETGPTEVFEEYVDIAVVTDAGNYGGAVKAALADTLSARYRMTVVDAPTAAANAGDYDGMVVQQIEPENVELLASATESPLTGVVWLDQWGSGSNGIEARSAELGEPGTTDQDGFGSGQVVFEVGEDHPIFDGVAAPGDSVEVHTGSFLDHAWFGDTDARVLADVADADGTKGAAIATMADSRTVYADSLGRTLWVGNGDYTAEADQVLANAVAWAADSPEPDGTLTVTNATAQPGDEAEVDLKTDADGVAGYEAYITYDPSVVQLTDVQGIDFSDPVANVNNSAGHVHLTSAQAEGADAPTFAELTFEVVGERGDATKLSLVASDTMLTDENGSEMLIALDNGGVSAAACELGDVNQDGEVTPGDATLTQQYIVGDDPENFNPACADMNDDGAITSADVTLILQKIVGGDQASVVRPSVALAR